VTGSIAVAGASWVFGGASTSPSTATFGLADLGTLATGDSKTVSASYVVSPAALGGDLVTVSSLLSGLSTPSNLPLFLIRNGTPLVVSPGPADLSFSTLTCEDTDGGLLLPGDDLTCNVNVTPVAGHEGVAAASATVVIPDQSQYVSGADSHDASSLTIGPGSLGDVAAATTKSAPFHLKVADGAAVGALLHPTGTVTATSIPLGGPVTFDLAGQYLIVGRKVVPGATPPGTPASPPPGTVRPTPQTATYTLKAKTIRIKLRYGHRHPNHYWVGGRRTFVYVKRFVTRTPNGSTVIKKVTVPKKGRYAPKHGTVRIRGTRLVYTLKRGRKAHDRFHYTVTDASGKRATGTVIVSRQKAPKKKR
jgi:hypothetical protein